MTDAQIKIDGLNEFVRSIKRLDADMPKVLRVGFNNAANIVVAYAKPKVPRKTGAAAGTIKATSTQTLVRVSEGSKRVPYMPWLDFGGTIGRRTAKKRKAAGGTGRTGPHRLFIKEGRYIWAGLAHEHDKVIDAVQQALNDAARSAGLVVD